MTDDQLPRYRYWGDRKPDARLATLAVATVRNMQELGQPRALEDSEEQPTVAVLRLYAPIDSWGGWWGVNAEEVSTALDALPDSIETIILRINSPGGEVPEALTILNMLRAHRAKLIAVVDGWAVSAASFIAAGCDETVMSPGTTMMIHDARIFAYGDPGFLRKMADRLDKDSDSIASIYVAKAGGTEADWRALMGPETWYTAKEAVEAGLADRVDVVPDAGVTETPGAAPEETAPGFEDDPENVFDLSMYRYAGRNHAPAPAAITRPHRPPAASAGGSTTPEGGSAVAFSDEQLTDMRRKLGIAEDADEATILAALDEALEERADNPANAKTSTGSVPEGHVVVSKAEWQEMRGNAERGAEAAKKLHDRDREATLDKYADRFIPANRDAWRGQYDLNPKATVEALEKLPVVIPLDELGHSVDESSEGAQSLDDVRNEPAYQNWRM